MKKSLVVLPLLVAMVGLTSCGLLDALNNEHQTEFSELSGKWVLKENLNKVQNIESAYFIIDGTKGKMTSQYYVNGELIKDQYFWVNYSKNDTPHKIAFNQTDSYKGKTTDGISLFIEQKIDEVTQFCLTSVSYGYEYIEGTYNGHEYKQLDNPYAPGIYVREDAEYYEFNTSIAKEAVYFNGFYYLDDDHYFNLLTVGYEGKKEIVNTYMVYYSPDLDQPIQGGLYVYFNDKLTSYDYGFYTTYETYWKLGKHAQYANADITFKGVTFDENSFSFTSAVHNKYSEWDGLELKSEYYFDETLDETIFIPGTYVKM